MAETEAVSGWRPLLDGDAAAAAGDVVEDIAASLAEPVATVAANGRPLPAGRDASLASGSAGMSLFFAYRALADAREGDDRAVALLESALDALGAAQLQPSLYVGFTGITWTLEHLASMVLDEDDEDLNEEIDEVLIELLGTTPWMAPTDLISGVVGLGVYALERLPRASAVATLEQAVSRLEETAVHDTDGIAWPTHPSLFPPDQAHEADNRIDLGMAHGVTGTIALLARVVDAGVAADRARALLDGAVSWLLAHVNAEESPVRFAPWIKRGQPRALSRTAWCYGDLGVALALQAAARAANQPSWADEALATARKAAARPRAETGVLDAGLCHGAAGLGHFFNRLFQATGDAKLARCARGWFERCVEMRQPGRGVAGYQGILRNVDGSEQRTDDPGFLTGAAGIGLALLGAISAVEPSWDRVLLADLAPRG